MSHCVPSWDLVDIHTNHDVFKLDYEVAELTWQNGQVAMQELGARRVPTKSQPTISWDNPRAADTLETIVNQATHQPNYKPQLMVNGGDLVPWQNHHKPIDKLNATGPTVTSDALVPSSNNGITDAGCSTRVESCSGDLRVARGDVCTPGSLHDWDMSLNESRSFGIGDTFDGDLGGQLLSSTSIGSPENTSSGRDYGSKSMFLDDSVCHCTIQGERNAIKEKKKDNLKSSKENKKDNFKSSMSHKRTAAIHNQSERKRRDKINQRMKTLQKLVPNSSKTDKASMLDEVIDYVKLLQAQVHMTNSINMSPMMMPLVTQQQQQMQQMSMMNSMGMGMGMGIGGIHPSIFMPMPSWNSRPTDRVVNTTTMTALDPMSAFLSSQSQPVNLDSYSRMAALYQHMQNQSCGPLPKK